MAEEDGERFLVEKSMGGICKLCDKLYENLVSHKRYHHSERINMCPICEMRVTAPKVLVHINHTHPIQIGIMPFGEDHQPGINALSGDELKNLMTHYGIETKDVVPYKYFSVSFNHEYNCYRWVAYSVSKGLLEVGLGKKRPPAFYKYCEKLGGSQPNSFTLSQLPTKCEHGHAAPARLYRGDEQAYAESCLFANISAQKVGFNSGLMSSSEHHERNLAKINELIIVLTGPVYSKDNVGWEDAGCGYTHCIPEGFFKINIIKNNGMADQYQSFLLPNTPDANQLFWYRSTIPEIQKLVDYPVTPVLHDETYTWDRPEQTKFCKVCNKSLFEKDYVAHQREHSLAFTCHHENCFQTFETKEEFEIHREQFHRKNEHRCNYPNCLYCGFSASELKTHQEGHEEKKHHCKECTLSFKHVKDLRLHRNQEHADLKNYYCPIPDCSAGFAAMNHLENHIVCCHSRMKQFYCTVDECLNRRFGTRILLRRHLTKFHLMDREEADEASNDQTLKKAVGTVLIDNSLDPLQLLKLSNEKRELVKVQREIANLSLA